MLFSVYARILATVPSGPTDDLETEEYFYLLTMPQGVGTCLERVTTMDDVLEPVSSRSSLNHAALALFGACFTLLSKDVDARGSLCGFLLHVDEATRCKRAVVLPG
jgi:hypothetical protein